MPSITNTPSRRIGLAAVAALLVAACTGPPVATPTSTAAATPTPSTSTTPTVESTPTDDVESAVVRIEAQGTFVGLEGVEAANMPGVGSGFFISDDPGISSAAAPGRTMVT